jgi:glycosyltransferase involved in cell wall biosynthesis
MAILDRQRETCLFYFRTLRLAHRLWPHVRQFHWKYVFEPHEIFYESGRNPARLKITEQAVHCRAAGLFPITHALADRMRDVLPVTTESLVSPLGHTGRNFHLPIYDPRVSPSFLYIGSLHRWKGLETAFQATADLGAPFHVVGDAGGLERSRAYCLENRFTHVIFHGQVSPEDAGKFYSPGAICLMPLSDQEMARWYTSPLKLFDYLAAARPVAAADLPTIREIVIDGEHARLLPVGDIPAWRDGLQELLADRESGLRLARNARQLAQFYTWSERAKPVVERLLTLI